MSLNVSIDSRDLNRLAKDLGVLAQATKERIPRRAWSSAIRSGQTQARAAVVEAGGFGKAGLTGWAKSGIRGRVVGPMQARIDANSGWKSLAYWSDSGKSTRKQYKSGVHVSGHYGARHFESGFIRAGNNGNTILAERAGKSRLPLKVYSSITPAHILHQVAPFNQIVEHVQGRYITEWHRQYEVALSGR